eukprot:gene22210-23286_t
MNPVALTTDTPHLPTGAGSQAVTLPTTAEKLAYLTANLEDVYELAIASGLVHDGARQTAADGEAVLMFNTGGWMTLSGACRAGLFDHFIPDDLTADPVPPAAVIEKRAAETQTSDSPKPSAA